jgi:hypothetical protein
VGRDYRRCLCRPRQQVQGRRALFQIRGNAGAGKKILSHTYNTPTAGRTRITFTSAFTNALATTDDILVIASRNGVWMYDVESDEEPRDGSGARSLVRIVG